jgi:hypothetical protein
MKTRIPGFCSVAGLLAIIAFVACTKGGGGSTDDWGNGGNGGPHVINTLDTTKPVIQINTPTTDQVFSSGSAINITGKVTDAEGLYQGYIRVINDANGSILKEQLYEIHGTTAYDFNISYTASVSAASNYTVTVFYEDHGLNSTSKSVKVKVNP